ncbi:MAG: hypothetical protein V3W34_16660 [Phycisphaerae bacterium]
MRSTKIVGTMMATALVSAGTVAGLNIGGEQRKDPQAPAITWNYSPSELVDGNLPDQADVGALEEMAENGTCDAVDFNGERFAATGGGTPVGVCCCDDFVGDCITAPGTCPSGSTQTNCPCATADCLIVG